MEENKIFTMQLAILVIIVTLFSEVLREMQALGIFSLIMLGFLIAQFFTYNLFYLSLNKKESRKKGA